MITTSPLVLNITNSVTIEFVANALLAVGASPVMSEDPEDAVDLARLSNSIHINIGTIDDRQEKIIDAVLGSSLDKPIVLDPVGCGATSLRTRVSKKILESGKISLVRGNASEISALAGNVGKTRGVDSTESTLSVIESAISLANIIQGIVVVSGEVDLVTDGKNTARVYNGSIRMTRVTGMGCVQSGFLAGVLGDSISDLEGLAKSVAYFGYMGEIAEKLSQGTGSFRIHFLDALSNSSFSDVRKYLKFEIGGL